MKFIKFCFYTKDSQTVYFVEIKRCLVPINNNGVTAPSMSQGVSKCNVSNRGIAHMLNNTTIFKI